MSSVRKVLWLTLFGTLLACAPLHDTVEPYRNDPHAAADLASRALRFCIDQDAAHAESLVRPFVTDGCSVWPDGRSYVECCVEHDIRYWCGGTAEDRSRADAELAECVSEKSSACLGSIMRLGVRIGGPPIFPVPYRWGYGHSYRGSYSPERSTN